MFKLKIVSLLALSAIVLSACGNGNVSEGDEYNVSKGKLIGTDTQKRYEDMMDKGDTVTIDGNRYILLDTRTKFEVERKINYKNDSLLMVKILSGDESGEIVWVSEKLLKKHAEKRDI